MGKNALVLGGGAPNFTLMSGALLALHESGIKFDLVYMAGAGAVVGLVYLSPKDLTPEQALRNTMNYGISDQIYSMCPINYKLFNKGGHAAELFRDRWTSIPEVRTAMHQYGMNDAQKLASDWLLFAGAMMCPTDVNYFSKGLCAHVPFIEDVVDFEKLKTVDPDYYVNAYSIKDESIVEFRKPNVDLHHFRAALSFPYIYPPYFIDGEPYYEGAAIDSLNLISLMHELAAQKKIDRVIVLDVMKADLIHRPRNLWDAYAQSIIVPLVANAEKELAIFMHWVDTGQIVKSPTSVSTRLHTALQQQNKPPGITARTVRFHVPKDHRPFMLDWSKSNLEKLFSVGYQSGQNFVNFHGHLFK